MFQAKEALLCPKEECSEPCHSSPTWGAINYFLISLQNMFPICSTSAPHVSLKIGSVPQKTLFPIYTGHIVPQIASPPMNTNRSSSPPRPHLSCYYLTATGDEVWYQSSSLVQFSLTGDFSSGRPIYVNDIKLYLYVHPWSLLDDGV